MSRQYLMFDLETLNDRPSAVVLDIAAAVFDIDEIDVFDDLVNDPERIFYVKLSVEDQVKNHKRTMGQGTMNWWAGQSEEAKRILRPTSKDVSLEEAMCLWSKFLAKHRFDKNSIGYCRGQSFDFPIAVSMMDDVFPGDPANNNFPVSFWNQRDVRTAIAHDLINPKNTKCPLPKGLFTGFVAHNSVHDVCRDVISLQHAWAYKTGKLEIPDEYDFY